MNYKYILFKNKRFRIIDNFKDLKRVRKGTEIAVVSRGLKGEVGAYQRQYFINEHFKFVYKWEVERNGRAYLIMKRIK